jgi:HPt (histidine-containing phosphotransfer) domain-containing protein
LIEIFLRVSPEQRGEMRRQISARRPELARMQAHKLKGGLYAVGAARLAEAIETMRVEIASESWTTVEEQWRDIERRFDALSAQLAELARGSRRPEAASRDV